MTTETVTAAHEPIITKYRPSELDQVIGQAETVRSLGPVIDNPSRPHTYLFIGPSGCGKTTLAKILARKFGCPPIGYTELDAGTHGKVDNIRELVDAMDYAPLQGSAKVLVLDECHVMGKESWNALLKSTETPPAHAYYIFCTTEESKVPEVLKTRATTYKLKSVPVQQLCEYAIQVCGWENIQFPVSEDEMLNWLITICEAATGSPRKLLNLLDKCRAAQSIQEVQALCQAADTSEGSPLIEICKLISRGEKASPTYMALIDQIEPDKWGGAKLVIGSYLWKVYKGRGGIEMAKVFEAWEKLPPYPNDKDGPAALGLFIARLTLK